jgi:NitT/TauT family transport system ATP-binding protein
MLQIDIQSKCYRESLTGKEHPVLDDIHIKLREGEFLAVVGPSGCGKSTLLHIVAGLDNRFKGRITWLDESTGNPNRLGYVFQNPRLLPWLNVRDNIALVLDDPSAKSQQIDALLEATELSRFSHYHPNQLSLGMQRRAALARAFVVEPSLLIMDEPFVSLDGPAAFQLRQLLLEILTVRRTTVIFVTHDLREATMLADRILFFSTSPARIIGEAQVDLAREKRRDEAVVDARYAELRTLFMRMYPQNKLSDDSPLPGPMSC